jgi:UDP-glucose 6-dehydrogenase
MPISFSNDIARIPGFGGSCLQEDVTAVVGQGKQHGLSMPLLKSVLEITAAFAATAGG